jgi:hypothetical protein
VLGDPRRGRGRARDGRPATNQQKPHSNQKHGSSHSPSSQADRKQAPTIAPKWSADDARPSALAASYQDYLDQLVELADQAGANTRRNELAAALLAVAPIDGDSLLQLVVDYRKRRVRNVVLDVPDAAQVIELPRYAPGRRRSG